jgi:hypothetical protein
MKDYNLTLRNLRASHTLRPTGQKIKILEKGGVKKKVYPANFGTWRGSSGTSVEFWYCVVE